MRKLTTEEFIEKSKEVHGLKYNYLQTVYLNAKSKVIINCPTHGDFEQLPYDHSRGRGCPTCGKESINIKNGRKFTQEQFIDRIKDIKGLTFRKTIYKNRRKKVIVTCDIHGDYKTSADALLKGAGCRKCSGLLNNGTWSFSDWETAGNNSEAFDNFKLYIIRCFNEEENFFKIGKTYNTIEKRFYSVPYQYQVIDIITGSARFISKLEVKLHQANKKYKYLPKRPFGGMNECFSIDCKITI